MKKYKEFIILLSSLILIIFGVLTFVLSIVRCEYVMFAPAIVCIALPLFAYYVFD